MKKSRYRRTNHRVHQAGRGRHADQGAVPQGRLQRCHALRAQALPGVFSSVEIRRGLKALCALAGSARDVTLNEL